MDIEELRVLIRTISDTRGASETNAALRNVQSTASGLFSNSGDAVRFGAALAGVGLGLNLAAGAADRVRETLRGAVDAQAENERTTRATALAYRESAGQFERFAASLSQQTGFTSQAILEAALSARTLSQNYGLTIAQTQKLISVSADLARVRGIGVAESFERIQSAIRGEAEASEFLGLTLNDTFLQQNAANGAYRQTFGTLTDLEKAQIRYTEVVKQSAQFSGLAASATNSLDGAMGRAALSAHNLQVELGKVIEPATLTGLGILAGNADELARSLQRAREDGVRFADVLQIIGVAIAQRLPLPRQLTSALAELGRGLAGVPPEPRPRTDPRQLELLGRMAEGEREDIASQLQASMGRARPIVTGFNEQLRVTHATLAQIAADINDVGTRSSVLSTLAQALGEANQEGQAQVGAQQVLQQLDQQILATRALAAIEQELQREREATKITDPRDAAGAQAARQRLQVLEQVLPLERELQATQANARAIADAQRQTSAQQAQIDLQLLGPRQEMARLDRLANDAGVELNRLMRERTTLLAQQRAAPALNALNDTQAQIERDRLRLAIRGGTSAEERAALRREIRDLTRGLPEQELRGFDARREVELAQRGASAGDLADEARRNAINQRQAEIRAQIQPIEEVRAAIDAQLQQLALIGQVLQGATATINHKIEITLNGQVTATASPEGLHAAMQQLEAEITGQLNEAVTQAQLPPVVQQSGVRRS